MEGDVRRDTGTGEAQGDAGRVDEGNRGRSFAWWKVAVVLLLGVAIATTLALRDSGERAEKKGRNNGNEAAEAATAEEKQQRAEERDEGASETGNALATVNGETITWTEFQSTLQELPSHYRRGGPELKLKLLDTFIEREVLLQEADEQGIEKPPVRAGSTCCGPSPEWKRDTARIEALIQQEALSDIDVSDREIRQYYRKHKDSYGEDRGFEELKSRLKRIVRRRKEREAADTYVAGLMDEADVKRPDNPFQKGEDEAAAQNPLDRALQKDVPVVADFGRGTCTPCKMMKPILEDLKKKYDGRAEVLIIDTGEHPDLARRCGIRAIPTQIFYDASGEEVDRHSGFMPREDLLAKLRELGVK